MWCMHRTNLYLSDEQERALDVRAKAAGISRSAYVRQMIDRELADDLVLDGELEVALGLVADRYHDMVEGLFDADPDLRIDS